MHVCIPSAQADNIGFPLSSHLLSLLLSLALSLSLSPLLYPLLSLPTFPLFLSLSLSMVGISLHHPYLHVALEEINLKMKGNLTFFAVRWL
jgi:hypothetical protein